MKRYYNVFSGAKVTFITDDGKIVEYQRDKPIPSQRTQSGELTDNTGKVIFSKPRNVFYQCYKECSIQ